MKEGTAVSVVVNGARTSGAYMHPIKGKKNRHCVAIQRAPWRRLHWVTVSTKKLTAAA